MAFVQTIEFETSRIDEVRQLEDEWVAATEGKRTATRSMLCADRDRPGTCVLVVEFPSYEAAMQNSALPETQRIAEQMQKLATGEPTFRNLDVVTARDV